MPNWTDPPTQEVVKGLYFYFNETTGDLVYSDKATYNVEGYVSLGEQTDMSPVSPDGWVFHDKRTSIRTVSKDPAISKIIGLTSMKSMFNGLLYATNIDVSGFDTSNVTSMIGMFGSCNALTSLDLSSFNTSNVTYMNGIFNHCAALTSLDLSSFNTSNVDDMRQMFLGCDALTSLDLSSFDTSKVTNMSYMFSGCHALTNLDLSNFDTSNVTDMRNMFTSGTALTSLDLSSFDTSKVTNKIDMFYNCNNLRIVDISPNMSSDVLSALPADTYYDAVTRQSYTKDTIPGGSTYVRDLADLDLVATMVQTRMGINKVKGMLNEVRDLKKQVDAVLQQTQSFTKGAIPVTVGTTPSPNRYFLVLTRGYNSPVTLNPGDTVTMRNMVDGHTPGTMLTFKGPGTFEVPTTGASSYFTFGEEFSENIVPAVKVYKASGDTELTADDLANLKATSGGIVYVPV